MASEPNRTGSNRLGPDRQRRRDPVYLVTRARRARSVNIKSRERNYLISMGIRTACLVVAIFAPVNWAIRGIAIAAAVVLPYIAVIFANAGPALTDEHPTTVEPQPQREIGGNRPALGAGREEERDPQA